MSDEILTVNSIVEKHAAENPPKQEDTGANNQSKIEGQSNLSAEDKAKAELEKTNADELAKAELEKNKATANPLDEFLKKHNVESLEALEEKLKSKEADTVLSPEEKAKRENVYKAKLQTFAVENGIMQLDDFTKLQTVKEKQDTDLVFEDWSKEYEDDNFEDFAKDFEKNNPDEVAGLSEKEIKEKAKGEFTAETKKAFDKKFKLNSEDEKIKAKGLEKLAKLAAEKRNPLESSYTKAKEKFDADLDLRNNYPQYDKTVRGFINESIPEKFVFYKGKDGEEEISVDIELSKEDKAEIAEEIAKKIQTIENYSTYKKGDMGALKDLSKKVADVFIENKYKEEGKQKMAEAFTKLGYKKGEIGAKNSFALNQDKPSATEKVSKGDAEKQVLDSLRGKK